MKPLDSMPDPSDWLKTRFPPLYQLDSMIRCNICKEYMSSPVLTGCGHCFCSLCIRTSLEATGKCPLCNGEQIESKLRKNLILEEIIIFFKRYREDLRDTLKDDTRHDQDENINSQAKPELINIDSDEEEENDVARTQQNSSPPAKRSLSPASSGMESQRAPYSRKKQAKAPSAVIDVLTLSSSQSTQKDSEKHEVENLSECPICHDFFPLAEIETTHIDACLNRSENDKSTTNEVTTTEVKARSSAPKKGSVLSNFFSKSNSTSSSAKSFSFDKDKQFQIQRSLNGNNKPLKKLNYSSLQTSKLKEKLNLLSLPTSGTRQQLEARYNQYAFLYNSNLDSVSPVPLKQLRSTLNQWEFFNNNLDSELMIATKQKEVDRGDWAKTHKDEFQSLIARARDSQKKAPDLGKTDSEQTLADDSQHTEQNNTTQASGENTLTEQD